MRSVISAMLFSVACCCASSEASTRLAMSSSRERISSSIVTASRSRSALCVFDVTSSSFCRSRKMSSRIFCRSGFCSGACAVRVITTKRTKSTKTLRPLRPLCGEKINLARSKVAQRMLRRLLLRLLFRRSLASGHETSHFHFDDESLVVVRPHLVDHVVVGQLQSSALRELLQRRLVILEEQVFGIDRVDVLQKRTFD